MKELQTRSSIDATVRIPGSKSITHRALITASLASGESDLEAFLASEDTLYTVKGLQELGVEISTDGDHAKVQGTGGDFPSAGSGREIFLGNSGTSYRLLLSTIALARGEYMVTGTPRMHDRPIGDLVRALSELGVEASCSQREDFPPVSVKAKGIRGGKVEIAGDKSSQYVSSLLLVAPYAEEDVEVEVTGGLVSQPYVDVTLDVMKTFGISVERDGYRYFKVYSGQRYGPRKFKIGGDISTASYFWAAAAVTGGTIRTANIHPHTTKQGDIGLLDIMEEMGCRIEKRAESVVVQGRALSGTEVDMGSMPDMVPTLAAMALFASGRTRIRNVSHLRLKESDRLRAIATEWRRLGGRIEELADGLVIHGGGPLSGTVVDSHNDHRIAMSLAVVGLRIPGLSIRGEGCVNKSFPGFWEMWYGL
ncbi:MAG: 3-phosphoshikimate 1-carboxyvinyltransferase [Desulfobacteraceae bacterium]|jgi:3-phosphoshikimate 1-carboxyvinyltransferase